MLKISLFAALVASSTAFAALPPLAQSIRELEAILQSDQTYSRLGGGSPIVEIDRVADGYLIKTNQQEMQVDVVYQPSKNIGPIPFKLVFHTPVDIE